MKRGKKLILLALVLVLLAGATYLAGTLNTEDDTQTTDEPAVTAFSIDPDAVTALSWDYSEPVDFTKGDDGWYYTSDSVFPLDEAFIEDILDTLTQIDASKVIADVTDLDQYGLEAPICAISVTTDTQYDLSIGEVTTLGGERYFSTGDGNVYLVDEAVIDCFQYELYDLIDYETLPVMDDVTALSVSGSYTLEYREASGLAYADSYVWFCGDQVLDTELTEALISSITGLSLGTCVEYNVSDPSQYGLDAPEVITVQYLETVQVATGETDEDGNAVYETRQDPAVFSLEIGSTLSGYRYARISGSNMVYLVTASTCDTVLFATANELLPDEVLLMEPSEITGFTAQLDGTDYSFAQATQEVTDDEGNVTEETVWMLDGQETDVEDLLDELTSLSSAGYAYGMTPEGKLELSFTLLRDRDTFSSVEICFYQYDSSTCMVTLDGSATVFVAREDIVSLKEAVNSILLQ